MDKKNPLTPSPSPRIGARGAKQEVGFTDDDDALLAELGVETEAKEVQTYTPKQERIIAGFEDVQRFAREHGRPPQHGASHDIFERLYAVRLDQIRADAECLELLRPLDNDGLLSGSDRSVSEGGVGREGTSAVGETEGDYDIDSDDELLNALGVGSDDDITTMKHVRTASQRSVERTSPDEVAQRKPCENFDEFRSEFEAVQAAIETGRQTTELYRTSIRTKIGKGDWFIVDGHKALVAGAGKWFMPGTNKPGQKVERDRRLRVIFDNGTESDLLLRSLRRALQKDEASRRIVPPQPDADEDDSDFGPLFSDAVDDDDTASGTIYVARSLSEDAFVQGNREVLHKIGVTGGDPTARVAGARKDPTFLLAEAELVATYKLANINRKALEQTLHKFFAKARLDLALADRFGEKVHPREWYLVPLPVIAEVVDRIKDGSISKFRYDAATASLQKRFLTKPGCSDLSDAE